MKKIKKFEDWLFEANKFTKNLNASDIFNHPSYKKSCEMVAQLSEDIEGNTFHHHMHVLYPLAEIMGESAKNYLEIGSFCGGSMCLMLQNENVKNFYSIDPFKAIAEQESKFDSNTKKYNKNGKSIKKFIGFSDDAKIIESVKNSIKGGVDILFIDGSHAYNMVKKDFENFNEMVNSGGFIVFDDYEDYKDSPGVKKAVDEMKENGSFDDFNVIGNFKNHAKAHDKLGLKNLNEYIIQKK